MPATNWIIDPSHSEITFKVRHLMITHVTGKFEKFTATAQMDETDLTKASVHFEAEAASVNTNAEQRDTHIRSADFFHVAASPKIIFESTMIQAVDPKNYILHGNLTMNGVTRPVTLDVESSGTMRDPYGRVKAGFSINGKINRKDWKLNWNVSLETGGVLVSDEVKIQCEVQMLQQEVTAS